MVDCEKCKHSVDNDESLDCSKFKKYVGSDAMFASRGLEYIDTWTVDARRATGACGLAGIGFEPKIVKWWHITL